MFWKKNTKSLGGRVYADAAAATPLSKNARAELLRLLSVYGNAGALHQEAVAANAELEHARSTIAQAIGAHPDEIIFTASGTEANNLAINGVLRPLLQAHGKLGAVTLAIEHQSVLEPLRALEPEGLHTTQLSVDKQGVVSVAELRDMLHEQTVFISVQWVNSEVGTIEPIREIAREVRRVRKERQSKGASRNAEGVLLSPLPLYFHCDASQAPLWLEVKVESLGVDLLTLDAQKVLGPKGVGALFVRRHTDVEPVIRGGVQEFGLRGGTPNVPLAGAFAVALVDAQRGVTDRAQTVAARRDFLFSEIQKKLPETVLNGPLLGEGRVANNLNISLLGLDGEMAVLAMDAEGVAVSTRSACNSGDEEPSHVIQALGVPKELAKTAVRITLLPDTTQAQVKKIANTFVRIAKRYQIVV